MTEYEWYAGRKRQLPVGHQKNWPARPASLWRLLSNIWVGIWRDAIVDEIRAWREVRRIYHRRMRCGHSGGHLWKHDEKQVSRGMEQLWRCHVCGHFEWFAPEDAPHPRIDV